MEPPLGKFSRSAPVIRYNAIKHINDDILGQNIDLHDLNQNVAKMPPKSKFEIQN